MRFLTKEDQSNTYADVLNSEFRTNPIITIMGFGQGLAGFGQGSKRYWTNLGEYGGITFLGIYAARFSLY
jgi:hypothetical protein